MRCPECRHSRFASEEELVSHLYRYHRKTRAKTIKYQCLLCQRTYMKLSSLKMHQKTCVSSDSSLKRPAEGTSSQSPEELISNVVYGEDETSDIQQCSLHFESEMDVATSDDSNQITGLPSSTLIASPEELLQEKIVQFLVNLKEGCNATQHIINEVVNGMDVIQRQFLQVFEALISEQAIGAEVISTDDIMRLLCDLKECSLFEGVKTKFQIESFLQEKKGFVKPEEIVFRSVQELKGGNLVTKKIDIAHRVPFLPQLEKLLNCKDVLYCVDNPPKTNPETFKTVLDGYYYKSHPVYKKDDKALAIILYVDGIEIVDPLSSRAGKHSITQFYWVLGNIHPQFRSSDRVINLLATIKTNLLKEYGYGTLLEDFIAGITQLSSDSGVTFNINDQARTFHGLLLCVCGDYPALGSIGGFKESVSAEKPCHECFASKVDYLTKTNIKEFQKRDFESHKKHLAEIEAYRSLTTLQKQQSQDPSVRYGINSRSELMKVPFFDPTKCLVQDVMHLGPEGTEELMCRLVLNHVILEKKTISLKMVNNSLKELSKNFRTDKPSEILEDHIKTKLRQSSSQIRNIALMLPFVLVKQREDRKYVFLGDSKYIDCYLAHLKMMNFAMSFEFQAIDVSHFKKLIKDFHEKLILLIPKPGMAKVHFWHHTPDEILLFGVLRQLACFGFEKHHSFFKRMARIIRNFINITFSLATRHQTRLSNFMMEENFLNTEYTYSIKKVIPVDSSDRNTNMVKALFQWEKSIEEATFLKFIGTTFKENTVILLTDYHEDPIFAMIKHVFIVDKSHYVFICLNLTVKSFVNELNAYEVEHSSTKVAIDGRKLKFPHEICCFRKDGKIFLIPLGHRKLMK